MTDRNANDRIYDQHQAAFRNVSAYVVTNAKGELVAKIAFKFATSGLRTTCFFHVLGLPMTKAFASGGGYDKASAAAHKAVHAENEWRSSPAVDTLRDMRAAIKDEGRLWDDDLRAAGFNVLQAV